MAVTMFYENDLNPERANRILLWDGSYADYEITEQEPYINKRPKLTDAVLGEYYPEVFICIDGKDYLVAKVKLSKKFGGYHD